MRAKFKIIEHTNNYILIRDECLKYECMSVTNDAEAVVEYLLKNYPEVNKKHIYYIDTDGHVDELAHDKIKFTRFEFGYDDIASFKTIKQQDKY